MPVSKARGGTARNIPAELKALPRWVCWESVPAGDGQKPAKRVGDHVDRRKLKPIRDVPQEGSPVVEQVDVLVVERTRQAGSKVTRRLDDLRDVHAQPAAGGEGVEEESVLHVQADREHER